MVADGDVVADNGVYCLTDRLVRRQEQQDEARSPRSKEWDESWEMAVVTAPMRPLAERFALRKAMVRLRLDELRERVWVGPDNRRRQPDRTAARQPTLFLSRYPHPPALLRQLWDLPCCAR